MFTRDGDIIIFHVSMGCPGRALSMHFNYTNSVEEDCPKKQRKSRNYGVSLQSVVPVGL